MIKITFEIKSRGSMLISFGDKKARVSGEFTFEPSVFYADIKSLQVWESPIKGELINEVDKSQIVKALSEEKAPTKIIFD